MKRKLKIAVDVLMLLVMVRLISQQAGMALDIHAILGACLFVLFVVHHLLNLGWYRTLFKGRYTPRRLALLTCNILLLISMMLTIISSVEISGLAFEFQFLPVNFAWRDIHVGSTAWTTILMSLHLGLHTSGLLKKLEGKQTAGYLVILAEVLLFAFGAYCFITSGMIWDMILQPQGSDALGYWQYFSIILSVAILVHAILLLTERGKKTPSGRKQ